MPSRSTVIRGTLLCVAIAALVLVAGRYLPDCATLQSGIRSLGAFAPLGYVALSIAASLLFLPRTPLVIAAGMVFGIPAAAALDLFASLVGATAGFFISRHLARERFLPLLHTGAWRRKAPWLAEVVDESENHGVSFVFLIRVVHVFPFCPMNYLCGLLPIHYGHYAIGTLLGLLPGTLALTYCGNVFGCLLVDGGAEMPLDLKMKLAVGGAILAVLSLVPMFLARRRAKKTRAAVE